MPPRPISSITLILLTTLAPALQSQHPPENPLDQTPRQPPKTTFAFRETDFLRRDGFTTARQATAVIHLLDRNGQSAPRLQPDDLKLIVNGTERTKRFQPPGESTTRTVPVVLLAFPPNQPVLHSIGIQQARKYFSAQPAELLPWKVAVFDSDGTQTPFTDGRSQLLAYLDVSDRKTQPFQYTTDLGQPQGVHWNGPWLNAAEKAVAAMQIADGPKVIIAYNPIREDLYGEIDKVLADDGPAALIPIAQSIGAHIYIANSGGPEVSVPGGDASRHSNGVGPSNFLAAGAQQRFATAGSAFRSSVIRLTAELTFGGYSNSLKDLAAQIHRNLDDNYTLTFDLTARDRDKGVPDVEVRLADSHQRLYIADLYPVTLAPSNDRRVVSKDQMAAMFKVAARPIPSSDLRITQQVDYFPLREGLQPVLPMSAAVEWTGKGPPPANLSVAEYVQNTNLSSSVLEREVESTWAGRGISWERDGHLYPGTYLWRVVLHDDTGTVFASADRKILVGTPLNPSLALSSLILGKSCRDEAVDASSLRKRADLTPQERDQAHFLIDPMKTADCRVRPEPTAHFAPPNLLHAFIRLYPTGKLSKKNQPETWTATYTLRSATGTAEFQRDLPFTPDSNSGYLAALTLPLDTPAIHPGPHTLEVQIQGPGIRKALLQSRSLTIAPAQKPEANPQ